MGLLQVEVPDVPEHRSGIVPARLARKLAPLFGVPWPDGPFGGRTWVSDYNKITLSDIARGAPGPPPRGSAAVGGASLEQGWVIAERQAVVAAGHSLPNEIANATLNRFGPDTKAAVVLTGANRLLAPVTAAVGEAMRLLVGTDGARLTPSLRAAAWTGLVLEVFRGQPVLVAAAIRARTIQRELLVDWSLPRGASAAGVPLTRCEVADRPAAAASSSARPGTLPLADDTIDVASGAARVEIVDRLLRELMAIGTGRSSSHLWLSERAPGRLVVEALVPPTELVSRFTGQIMHVLDEADDDVRLPRIPSAGELSALSRLARRAVVLTLLTVLRQVQFDAEMREQTRGPVVDALDAVSVLATTSLGPVDPVSVLCRCRVADMRVHTLRHDVRNDVGYAVEDLMRKIDHCVVLCDDGVIDRGAAAEAISSANVEINVVRRTNARRPDAKLPPPADLDAWLQTSWAAYLRILEVDARPPVQAAADPRVAAGHHLHNYAAFLASHTDDADDLRAAVEIFETAVIPARELYWTRTQSFLPLRQSLQVASRATTTLSRLAAAASRRNEARDWAAVGYRWISRALAEQDTRDLLETVTEPAAHFCLLAAPALLAAVDAEVPGSGPADVLRARHLVATVRSWVDRATDGQSRSYSRYDELVDLERRTGRLADP